MEEKAKKYDIDGYDILTTAIRELINQYPGLNDGDEITFSSLEENSGKALFPLSGAAIEKESEFITGEVEQICVYPFMIIYRASGLSENRKASVKEWLDNLGRWLEKQVIAINGAEHKLTEYPQLTDGRKFITISRSSPAYLDSVEENNAENWAISIIAKYKNNFER